MPLSELPTQPGEAKSALSSIHASFSLCLGLWWAGPVAASGDYIAFMSHFQLFSLGRTARAIFIHLLVWRASALESCLGHGNKPGHDSAEADGRTGLCGCGLQGGLDPEVPCYKVASGPQDTHPTPQAGMWTDGVDTAPSPALSGHRDSRLRAVVRCLGTVRAPKL